MARVHIASTIHGEQVKVLQNGQEEFLIIAPGDELALEVDSDCEISICIPDDSKQLKLF